MVSEGYTATLVAATLAISRSSLYYRKKPRGSRADRTYDEQIVMACGEKLAYGYRRVAWWLQRKIRTAGESEACVAGDARTRVAGALAAASCSSPERVGPCGSQRPQPNLAVGHDEDLGGAGSGLGLFGERYRLLHAGDRGLESLPPLPNARCVGSGRASSPDTAARGQS